VLQAWSKNTFPERLTSVGFLVLFGFAAAWGVRALIGYPH
jgi:hypothetical protein